MLTLIPGDTAPEVVAISDLDGAALIKKAVQYLALGVLLTDEQLTDSETIELLDDLKRGQSSLRHLINRMKRADSGAQPLRLIKSVNE